MRGLGGGLTWKLDLFVFFSPGIPAYKDSENGTKGYVS